MSSASFEPAPSPPQDLDDVAGLRQDLVLIPSSAFVLGFVSGLLTSSRLSGRQFLAENAHRLPTTVQGWYFYQKTKNYRVMYGGVVGGLKTGTRLGLWTAAFVTLQEGVEKGLERTSVGEQYPTRWLSGGVAGLGLAGAASQLYGLSKYGWMRRSVMGLSLGAVAGGAHDLRDWAKTKLPPRDAVEE